MNAEVLAKIAVRILSLYLIAAGLTQLPNLSIAFQSLSTSSGDPDYFDANLFFIVVIGATSAPLLIGILFWFLSERLSAFVLKGIDTAEEGAVSVYQVQAIALASVGLVILVHAIPQIISIAVQISNANAPVNESLRIGTYYGALLWASAAKIILAVSLVVGASGWIKLFRKLRGFGLE